MVGWGIPEIPISRSSPMSFAPTTKFQLPPPRLPNLHTPFLILSSSCSQRDLGQKKSGVPRPAPNPPKGSPQPRMETKLLTAHKAERAGLCPPVHPHLPLLLLIRSQKTKLLTLPRSCQPFPQQGTHSHFLHFQGELVKPLSSTLFLPLALTTAAPWRGAGLDGYMHEAAGLRAIGKEWRNQILAESTGPLTSKGVCDPFRTHNGALTHSGLSFSRYRPGLGFGTGGHEHAFLVPQPAGTPTAPLLGGPESRDSEPTSSPGGAPPLGLHARALPGNGLLPSSPAPRRRPGSAPWTENPHVKPDHVT